ncbi:unnamed protein product, partial [Medioppia subpectinata]
TFHKITLECSNTWDERPVRWTGDSPVETINGVNLSVLIDSPVPSDLLLAQLTIDRDCGYPDVPIDGNYSLHGLNVVYGCISGALRGKHNLACLNNGQWAQQSAPRCCLSNSCALIDKSGDNDGSTVTVVMITLLSMAVIGISVVSALLFVRARKR